MMENLNSQSQLGVKLIPRSLKFIFWVTVAEFLVYAAIYWLLQLFPVPKNIAGWSILLTISFIFSFPIFIMGTIMPIVKIFLALRNLFSKNQILFNLLAVTVTLFHPLVFSYLDIFTRKFINVIVFQSPHLPAIEEATMTVPHAVWAQISIFIFFIFFLFVVYAIVPRHSVLPTTRRATMYSIVTLLLLFSLIIVSYVYVDRQAWVIAERNAIRESMVEQGIDPANAVRVVPTISEVISSDGFLVTINWKHPVAGVISGTKLVVFYSEPFDYVVNPYQQVFVFHNAASCIVGRAADSYQCTLKFKKRIYEVRESKNYSFYRDSSH